MSDVWSLAGIQSADVRLCLLTGPERITVRWERLVDERKEPDTRGVLSVIIVLRWVLGGRSGGEGSTTAFMALNFTVFLLDDDPAVLKAVGSAASRWLRNQDLLFGRGLRKRTRCLDTWVPCA